jgi:hypothetical protein
MNAAQAFDGRAPDPRLAYTQPAVSFGTVAVSGNIAYAVPFFSPASGGVITRLGLQVVATTTISPASQCEVGLYNAYAGAPSTLIKDAGAVSVTSTGAISSSAIAVELAPQTLYFLVVGCNGSVSLQGVVAGGGLSAPLVGASNFATTSTLLSNTWTFAANGLVSPFASASDPVTITAGGPVPNVYAEP